MSVGEREAFCFLVKKNTLAPSVASILIDIRLFARFLASREKPREKSGLLPPSTNKQTEGLGRLVWDEVELKV